MCVHEGKTLSFKVILVLEKVQCDADAQIQGTGCVYRFLEMITITFCQTHRTVSLSSNENEKLDVLFI